METLFIENWLCSLAVISCYFLTACLICREVFIKHFIGKEIAHSQNKAINRMRKLGCRFDNKAIAFIMIPPFLFGSASLLLDLSNASMLSIWTLYFYVISFAFFSLLIGNLFYFKTYNNHFDIFIFGLIEDDTKSVLKNIYEDYPIIKLSILLILLSSIPPSIIFYTLEHSLFNFEISFSAKSILFISALLLLAYFARGTIKTQPLGKVHAQVSSLGIINKIVPNGIIAFSWALSDRKRDIQFNPVDREKGKILTQKALNQESLYATTKPNAYLENNPPHVVFALMESFGCNILQFDHPQTNDLLGNLRPYYQNSFVFDRFTSAYNGTAPSLASIYFHSPIQNISQSVAQKTILNNTPFFTYKKKGYRTIFITSGNLMWRNLANYLPLQGVDEIYGENEIIDYFPQAKQSQSYWGIADEYAFSFAEKLLLETDKPLFINILTMTNHPPHKVPNHYQIKPLDPSVLDHRLGKDENEQLAVLSTFQYSANALGNFIDHIENSEIKNNVIIAASGDHHMRGMRMELPKELFIANAVPFLIHIPSELKKHIEIEFNRLQIGSHKDIMPTLYGLSLSDCRYWHLGGKNLLSQDKSYSFSYNESIWADDEGVIDLNGDLTKYPWQNNTNQLGEQIPCTEEQIEKIHAYLDLLYWQINYQIKGEIISPT